MSDLETCKQLATGIRAAIGDGVELATREDSRAFGAMLEARVADMWPPICNRMGAQPLPRPGRRTLYDLALRRDGRLWGLDLKTRDLDTGRYTDGGICSVGNLLRFLVKEEGVFVVAELTHAAAPGGGRLLRDVHVAPLHLLPLECLRIENLGTGQLRLDATTSDPWTAVDWSRPLPAFLDAFSLLAITHYARVGEVARQRAQSMEEFRVSRFTRLRLK